MQDRRSDEPNIWTLFDIAKEPTSGEKKNYG